MHTPGPTAFEHCSRQRQRKSPRTPSPLPGEAACSPSLPGPVLRRGCVVEGQAYFLQNLLLLQLTQISTGKPCTLATSCISPSYTWFLLVLALLLTLFPVGQGSANFLCKGPDTKHFRLCGCRVSIPTQLCHHEHESGHRNR